ncbi:MAG: glutamate mutase L, partial [Treponema sp.]|nr:glutamate mutase L [Treponema sp.]
MKIDILVAEIGSTTTLVNAFTGVNSPEPVFWGQGEAATSVLEGDVRVGLRGAVDDLCRNKGLAGLDYGEMLATSSAAGGLKMTVHGLVYDMTAKAAREAALGAGAVLKMVTAGLLREGDLDEIQAIKPNIIMLAGGVDHGERDTAPANAKSLKALGIKAPVIYAGNIDAQTEIKSIFEGTGIPLYIVENVYPRIDELNVEPARKIIQAVFEEHIIHAPGMEHIRDMVTGPIIPTPGAVMESA